MKTQLKKIEIDNWKSIKSLSVELNDINVLIGPNGAGKSNVVQFFHMLNMMMTGGLQIFVGRAGHASTLLHYGPKASLNIDSKLVFESDAGTNTYSFRLIHGAPDSLFFASERVEYRAKDMQAKGKPFVQEFGAGHKETELNEFRANQNSVFRFFRSRLAACRYFQFHDTSTEARMRTACATDNYWSLFHNAGNLAAVLLRLQREFPNSYSRVVGLVRATVSAFKDFVLEPQDGFVMLDWIDSHKGQRFGPHQLSDGSIRAIALFTLLSLPTLMTPEVIIIDEPELGLFPSAIDLLADTIKEASKSSQIILATQSNRLVRYLNLDSVVGCSWKNGESTIRRMSPADEFEFLDNYTLGDYMSR